MAGSQHKGFNMAYIKESQKSRKLNYKAESASTTREYLLVDYVDSQAALAALTSFIPLSIVVGNYLCVLPEYQITPVLDDPERTVFKGVVTWNSPDSDSGGGEDPQEPEDDTSFSFSFASMEDVKLYSDDQKTYGPDSNVPATNKEDGINRQHPDAMPEGMAINKAIVTITAKTVISGSVATNQWFKDRLDQVWTLNNSTWRSLPPRSVAFTGMQGDRRSDGNWNITYNFEYRPDNAGYAWKTKDKDGNPQTINTPATRGWDYVWAAWDKFTVDDSEAEKKTQRVIKAVHIVEDVYPTSDFYALGMVGV